MEQRLSSACQMFLIPTSILFAALAASSTEQLKTLLSCMGLLASLVWFCRMWVWRDLAPADQKTALALSGIFVLAWGIALPVHATLWLDAP